MPFWTMGSQILRSEKWLLFEFLALLLELGGVLVGVQELLALLDGVLQGVLVGRRQLALQLPFSFSASLSELLME
jgi:hypothetical protein